MTTTKPFYITRIDSNMVHLIAGAELFSVPGPVMDTRFCSYARNMIDLYKDAHAFLLEEARRHLEREAIEMGLDEINEVDLVELNRLCQVSFTHLEKITDPDEIYILEMAIHSQKELETYPQDRDAQTYTQQINACLRRHLTGLGKCLVELRQHCTIAEIKLVALHNEA